MHFIILDQCLEAQLQKHLPEVNANTVHPPPLHRPCLNLCNGPEIISHNGDPGRYGSTEERFSD